MNDSVRGQASENGQQSPADKELTAPENDATGGGSAKVGFSQGYATREIFCLGIRMAGDPASPKQLAEFAKILPSVAERIIRMAKREQNNHHQKEEDHFCWIGNCLRETVTQRWGHRLKLVFVQAGLREGRPHRLRDTFAVELLKAGAAMEDVSVLLGHSNIRVTEQCYAPWCPRRRERLNRVVMRAWSHDPLGSVARDKGDTA